MQSCALSRWKVIVSLKSSLVNILCVYDVNHRPIDGGSLLGQTVCFLFLVSQYIIYVSTILYFKFTVAGTMVFPTRTHPCERQILSRPSTLQPELFPAQP